MPQVTTTNHQLSTRNNSKHLQAPSSKHSTINREEEVPQYDLKKPLANP